jgi:hypothetical protein
LSFVNTAIPEGTSWQNARRKFISEIDSKNEVKPDPVISNIPKLDLPILILNIPSFVHAFKEVPTWKTVLVKTEDECVRAIESSQFSMFIALSPVAQSGLAGKMIELFKLKNEKAVTVYHGWTYDLSKTLPRALKYKADLAIVGSINGGDLIYLLGSAIICKREMGIIPSLDFYNKILGYTCSHSPFWQMQKLPCPAENIE